MGVLSLSTSLRDVRLQSKWAMWIAILGIKAGEFADREYVKSITLLSKGIGSSEHPCKERAGKTLQNWVCNGV